MITCPNCGERHENPGKFCTSCGAPLENTAPAAAPVTDQAPETASVPVATPAPDVVGAAEPPAAGRKKSTAIIIAAAVVVIGLIAIGAVLLAGALRSPADKFVDIHRDAYLSPLSSAISEYVTASQKAGADGFSGDITLSFDSRLDDNYYAEVNSMLNALSIDLSADTDSKGGVLGIGINYNDDTLLSGTFTGDGESIGIQLPELDGNYYTMSLDAFYALMGDMSGTDMGGSTDELRERIARLDAKAVQKLMDDAAELLFSCVTKSSVSTEKRLVRLEYLDEGEECTVYTFTPDGDAIRDALVALAGYLENNETAIELFTIAAHYIHFGSGQEIDESSVRADYDAIINDLESNARDIGSSLADSGFTWTTAMDGMRIFLDSISFTDSYGEAVNIRYESCGEANDERHDVFVYEDGWGQFILSNEYELEGKRLDGKLDMYMDYEDISIDYNIDLGKQSALGLWYGDYDVSYYGERICKLRVAAGNTGGSDHGLDIYTYDGTVAVTLHSSDKKSDIKLPAAPATDISDYSPEEISAIFENMLPELEAIFYDFYEDMYYSGYYY